ncbi:penicillin-binding protein 2 [Compostibacter hankyongensis]|uniref:Penicillin-binding protein 2 n=1 Tax=Compostibacter hankyongensis TaxID=1007089 RepID=A0ABP8FF14_9BACT
MPVYNQSRKNVIRALFIAVICILGLRLFYLQIMEKKYRLLATAQAIQRKTVYPTRGIIYDRKGRAVVNNDALYDLMVTPSEVKSLDTAYFCSLLNIDIPTFRTRLHRAMVRNGPVRPSVFAPLLPQDVFGRLQENIYQFPGFDLVERPVRNYPFGVGAHIFGFIGEVDSNVIKRNSLYQAGDFIGITGLEQTYEPILMGQRGVNYVVRDVRNRIVGSYENGTYDTAAIAGKNLHLALDIKLQQLGEELLHGKIGSIIAIDPQTGGVLTMVSSPEFDPNALKGAEKGNNYIKLLRDPAKPLFNRAIQAAYPPGSTFKPLDALAALDLGVITPAFGISCTGAYYGCGRVMHCTEHWAGHSRDLRTAIAWSCNSYFADIYRKIIDQRHNVVAGLQSWKKYMNAFGLGQRLGIDLPHEGTGNIPDTGTYNRLFGKGHWSSCSIISCAIGQGEVLETPLQIANAMCIIGNHGYYYTPHFVVSVDNDSSLLSPFHIKHTVTHIPDEMYQVVVNGMEDVVKQGTGRIAQIEGISVCGKTGTAQNPHGKDHSLFAAFAPKDHPRIAIAVVVENAGYGATYAAPIASLMMEQYLKDSIPSGPRTELMKRMKNTTILPQYLLDEMKQMKAKDSIRIVKKERREKAREVAVNWKP